MIDRMGEPGVPVLLASAADLRPRRWIYFAIATFFAFLGFSFTLAALFHRPGVTISGGEALIFTLVLGVLGLLGALWQLLRRREVRLDRGMREVLVCNSLGFAPAWDRIALDRFDRVQVAKSSFEDSNGKVWHEYTARLAGPGREPVALSVATGERMLAVRAAVRAAARTGLPLELAVGGSTPRRISAERVARYAAEVEGEDLPWWRQPAAIGLVLSGLVPFFGALFLGWGLLGTLAVFWIDNVAFLLFGLVRMLAARGGDDDSSAGDRIGGVLVGGLMGTAFTLFQGAFLLLLFAPEALKAAGYPGINPLPLGWTLAVPAAGLATGALAAFASRAFEFYDTFIRSGEWREADPGSQFPLGRVILMHLGILGGGFAAGITQAPVAMLGVLVLLKTWADLAIYMGRYRLRGAASLRSLVAGLAR